MRWVIPAICGVVLGTGLGLALADTGRGVGLLAPIAMWTLVYLSSFLDNGLGRRGWHDKAAGTIVIKVPRPDPATD